MNMFLFFKNVFVYAACTHSPCVISDSFPYFELIVNLLIIFSTVVLFILLIITGVSYFFQKGDKRKIESIRKRLLFTVIGYVFIYIPFILFPILKSYTGVINLVDNNGNNSSNLSSTYTPTPLPSYLISSVTPPSVSSDGANYATDSVHYQINDLGCPVQVVDGFPIFHQDMNPATNLRQLVASYYGIDPKKPIADQLTSKEFNCYQWGEYSSSNEASAYGGCSCSDSSLAAVVDYWYNRTYQSSGTFSISDVLNINEADGTGCVINSNTPQGFSQYGKWGNFVNTANLLSNTYKGPGKPIKFVGSTLFSGSNFEVPNTLYNLNHYLAPVVNAGYPVLMGMDDHFIVLLQVNNVSNDGSGESVVAFDSAGHMAFNYGGARNPNGTYYAPATSDMTAGYPASNKGPGGIQVNYQINHTLDDFLDEWDVQGVSSNPGGGLGYAFILEPSTYNETFPK